MQTSSPGKQLDYIPFENNINLLNQVCSLHLFRDVILQKDKEPVA